MHKDKEKHVRTLIVAAAVTAAALFSSQAEAARSFSSNTVYFDASGKVIGQNVYYCNNVHQSGGNLTSPYYLYIKAGCGDQIVECNGKGSCEDKPIDNAIEYHLYGTPPFTEEEACQLTNAACTSQEPWIVDGTDFVMS
ncbi:hypothetical protein QE438_001664 [Pseudoxanthomonas sp. SORGH_AS 997]|uniref:Secreted protein n=1 Tax=Pseudoxanthomonas winnipegensis TaxID=2480810 RepID=A0AAW8GB13_9GAMM|nr:hypothetical protein [Pseudoxanthomonas winnipegensis]MDQ1118440.1 hypothetical protein [Pseudoxanthomonas winnipegensis]MDQ1131624.1 hypothetical protein [Pseudoxanthomonas winnipegensis]MDR6138360.1 hypothetical protein [Pseudoxanthomonas sp. SORGH_AS_0997]